MKECARRKQYVEVVATHYIDGSVRPQKIVLATGPVFDIEDSREAAPGKACITGELARRFMVGSLDWNQRSRLPARSE